MAKRQISRIVTPLGYAVVLTRNRWREITRFKHPAAAAFEEETRQCLKQPDIIRSSSKNEDVHLYYLKIGNKYLCVVVSAPPDAGDDRFVITVYITKRVKPGNELWRK